MPPPETRIAAASAQPKGFNRGGMRPKNSEGEVEFGPRAAGELTRANGEVEGETDRQHPSQGDIVLRAYLVAITRVE